MSSQRAPFDALSVVDFGLGLAGGLVGQMLKDLGADIYRCEPAAGDPFYGIHSAYSTWQKGKEIATASDLSEGIDLMKPHLAQADFCIVGGEDYPNLTWRPDVDALAASHPRLIILSITGGRYGTSGAALPCIEILAQAHAGLMFEQYPDRPALYAFPAGSYGAALQGMIGLCAALCERERSGKGQTVRTSLVEGIMSWLGHDWYAFDEPSQVSRDTTPKGARPLVFRCADDRYLHIVLGSTDSRRHVFTLLNVENPVPTLAEDPRGLPSVTREARDYYGDKDTLQAHIGKWRRDELLSALWELGVAAEAVNQPGECWDDEQVSFNQLLMRDAEGYRRVGLPFNLSVPATAELRGNQNRTPQVLGSEAPLTGIRVVDFGSFTAGPHASVVLSDLGADVIKVEPLTGDVMRFYFLKYTASSRGKRVIGLDLKNKEGRDIALKLCDRADMVHHNFRPGVTKRLAIDVDTLHRRKPELILLETAAYGVAGPSAERGGFDMMFHGYCGHEFRECGDGNEPENYRLPIVDLSAGLLGAISSLIARYSYLRTGVGAQIGTSLLNSGLYLLSELVQSPDGPFLTLPQLNQQQTGFHPTEAIYAVGNDWLAVAAVDDPMAKRMLGVLGLEAIITRPRKTWAEPEALLIAHAVAGREPKSLLEELMHAHVWAVACRADAKQLTLNDPAMRVGNGIISAEDPKYGAIRQLGTQFTLSRSPTVGRGVTPSVGEHTRAILHELGYGSEQIDQLYRDKVVA